MCTALCPNGLQPELHKPLSYWNAYRVLLRTSRENGHAALFTAVRECGTSLINLKQDKYFNALLLVIDWCIIYMDPNTIGAHYLLDKSTEKKQVECHSICDVKYVEFKDCLAFQKCWLVFLYF